MVYVEIEGSYRYCVIEALLKFKEGYYRAVRVVDSREKCLFQLNSRVVWEAVPLPNDIYNGVVLLNDFIKSRYSGIRDYTIKVDSDDLSIIELKDHMGISSSIKLKDNMYIVVSNMVEFYGFYKNTESIYIMLGSEYSAYRRYDTIKGSTDIFICDVGGMSYV